MPTELEPQQKDSTVKPTQSCYLPEKAFFWPLTKLENVFQGSPPTPLISPFFPVGQSQVADSSILPLTK